MSTISLTTRCYIESVRALSLTVGVGAAAVTHRIAIPSCLYAGPSGADPNSGLGRRRRMVPDEPAVVPARPSVWIDDRYLFNVKSSLLCRLL